MIKINLVHQIIIAIILSVSLVMVSPSTAALMAPLGALFISGLKSVAPVLVFILTLASIVNYKATTNSNLRSIMSLYLLCPFLAALTAVIASMLFPLTIPTLANVEHTITPPQSVLEVFTFLLHKVVENPISAIINANYVGLLAWGVALGIPLRQSGESTKALIVDLSEATSFVVRIIISFVPIGIFGIIASTFADIGLSALTQYLDILILLVACMLMVIFVINPILIYWKTRKNPYPLILLTLRESGLTAFLTRSSAANIPINMALCKRLNLPEDTYSISIPLGATVNMAGAAITITILTLATVNTLGMSYGLFTALTLSLIATLCAAGAAGVSGGSLLLIPVACNLFGISNEISMTVVVSVGFVISVIQDSVETAVNSSTDVAFTAAVCQQLTSPPKDLK